MPLFQHDPHYPHANSMIAIERGGHSGLLFFLVPRPLPFIGSETGMRDFGRSLRCRRGHRASRRPQNLITLSTLTL